MRRSPSLPMPGSNWLKALLRPAYRCRNPASAWHWIRFPPLRRLWHRCVFAAADLLRLWKSPAPAGRYKALEELRWLYHSRRPVLRAESGSGLAELFRRQRADRGRLLPQGFQVEERRWVSAVGDLLPARGLAASQDRLYDRIAPRLFGADLSIANFEAVLTRKRLDARITGLHEPIRMTVSPAELRALTRHRRQRFSILHTANNHVLDLGIEGFDRTHDHLEAEGFLTLGTHREARDAGRGLIVQAGGIRLGLVAAVYGLNAELPKEEAYRVDLEPLHAPPSRRGCRGLHRQMEWCRRSGCDLILASLHWGHEFELYPRARQVALARRLAEAGADVILSHHSHMLQPWELYPVRRDPGRRVPIFYGLGNLVSLFSAPYNALSGVLRLGIVRGRQGRAARTLVASAEISPVLQVESQGGEPRFLRLELLHDLLSQPLHPPARTYVEEAARHADRALGPGWRRSGRLQIGDDPREARGRSPGPAGASRGSCAEPPVACQARPR